MAIKVVLFDLWGTLAKISKGDVWPKVAARLGYKNNIIKEIDRRIIVSPRITQKLLVSTLKELKISYTIKEIKLLYRILTNIKNQNYTIYSDTKIIDKLKDKYTLAIISNVIPSTAKRIRKKLSEFLKKFDYLFFSCELGIAKPDKRIYRKVLEKMNVEPCEVLVIGDSLEKDIFPARSLGMNAVFLDRDKAAKDSIHSLELLLKELKKHEKKCAFEKESRR